MRLLLNLVPIKSGGGQQVATNFIKIAQERKDIDIIYLVTSGTVVHKLLNSIGVKKNKIIEIENGLLHRFKFITFKLKQLVKQQNIDIIYTLFGPGLKVKGVKSVTGCAYSNLFFPEIDFWKDYSFLQRIKLKAIDYYRLKTTLRSDAIVFENPAIKKRAGELFNYPSHNLHLVLPSISTQGISEKSEEFNNRLKILKEDYFYVLMLTGWHKNKNIEIVPQVLKELKDKGEDKVRFIITVPDHVSQSQELITAAKEKGVQENLLLFGSVLPYEVPSLINRINLIALLSKLESFSNNIIEAWVYKKPIMISDEAWSRSLCHDAALYVDRDDARDIAEKIIKIKNSKRMQEEIVEQYSEILESYPSPELKVTQQLTILKNIWNESSS